LLDCPRAALRPGVDDRFGRGAKNIMSGFHVKRLPELRAA
jgi:hypothetical protein